MLFYSCQKESVELIDETTDNTITANSPLSNLVLRTTQNAGIDDDIIDRNSCCSVFYPVGVVVNGQQLMIENQSDLQLIRDIYDLFPNDTDTLEIDYPIDLIYENYNIYPINNETELVRYSDDCSGSNEITCIDYVYPITYFTYNSNQQQTGSIVVHNDVEMYLFLQDLSTDDFISIDFPISVILADGNILVVNNNLELETAIMDCVNNANTDPVDPTQFEQDLTNGVWYVTYYFDDYDETSDFFGYEFSFALDHTALAVINSTSVNGEWNFMGGSQPELDLYFGVDTPLDELDEDWEILESNSELIRLKHISGSDGSTDLLTFGRTPNSGGSNADINNFIENITTGIWYVNLFDNGIDQTCNYRDYVFTYMANGIVTAEGISSTIEGFWVVENGSSGLELILNFNGMGSTFEDLNDDWDVSEFNTSIIRLEDSNGGDDDLLSFGRFPPDCGGGGGPDPQVLRDIMISGTWYIDAYLDDGDDETSDYMGYNFDFASDETVSAFNGSQYVSGIWIITVAGDDFNLEFDMDSPINGADDDEYKALQYTATSVTFITRDSDGNIEDTLVFKKN